MRVMDPGHDYELDVLDGDFTIQLTFVKRVGEGYPGNLTDYPGTNMQEVLRALIDRCKYVENQIPDERTRAAMWHLRRAMVQLEVRAAERHGREWDIGNNLDIERYRPCEKCGHIGCDGTCH